MKTWKSQKQIDNEKDELIKELKKTIAEKDQALQLLQPDVITSVCDNCKDVTGFYLGTTCQKCNRPFRVVKQTEL